MPRIIENLRTGFLRYPGGGRQAMNTIFIRNLVDAVFLALERENAVGQAFNLTDGEKVTKRQFIEKICDALDLAKPTRTPPMWFAHSITWSYEKLYRLMGAKNAPPYNFARLKFMGLNLDFSIDKARQALGYHPRVSFDDGMAETMASYKTTSS